MGRAFINTGDFVTAELLLKKGKELSPESTNAYYWLAWLYRQTKEYEKGILELTQAEKINPTSGIIDDLGWMHYLNNDLEKAKSYWSRYLEIERNFEDSTQTVPYRHRLGMTYLKMGRKREADTLFKAALKIESELLRKQRSLGAWGNLGGTYYDHAVVSSYLGDATKAVQYLDSALHYDIGWFWGYHFDPLLDGLRSRDDFKRVLQKVIDNDELKKRSFSNALNKMRASDELKNILK
jgi:tetratricopeptide (TPR) repeat protein